MPFKKKPTKGSVTKPAVIKETSPGKKPTAAHKKGTRK